MTNTPAELAALADIIEASEPPFTGIAVGWWLLAAVLLLFMAAFSYWLYHKRQQTRYNQALQEARDALAQINVQRSEAPQQINVLLKRVIRHYAPDSGLLSCSLAEWQAFLQQQNATNQLPDLTALLYQSNADPKQTALFADFANNWLQQCNGHQLADAIKEQPHA